MDILGYGAEQANGVIRLTSPIGSTPSSLLFHSAAFLRERHATDRLCIDVLEQRSGQLLFYEHVLCDDEDFAMLAKNLVPFLASDCLTTGPTIGSTSWTSRLHANFLRETQ